MTSNIKSKPIVDSLWFFLLAVYTATGYFAQDMILPASINSLTLYVFLGYSLFAVLCYGKIKLTTIIGWEAICLAFSFVAMLYSPAFSIFDGTYYSLIVNFILVFILMQMPWNEERFEMILKTYVVSSGALIVILAATGKLEDSSDTGRLGQDLVGNANIFAVMLMVSAIYAIWLLVSSRKKSTKFFSLAFLIIIYIGMFLSGGRKYIIVPVVFLYILLVNKTDKKGRKHLLLYTFLIVAILFLLYQIIMNVEFFYDSIGNRFEDFFSLFDGGSDVDGSTIKRQKMIEAAWKTWPERPLFGHGFDSFKFYNAESVLGKMVYSHNNFVELLYNEGLVGFVVYYSFYAYLLYKAFKIKGQTLYKGFVIGVIISWLFFEYFGITYNTTPTQIMLFLSFYILKKVSLGENETIK